MENWQEERRSAFVFSGSWREFAPIAFTNLLLTIVTLGIYRFWAKTRERQYLWTHTRFIDDDLQWAGTGKELFIGFLFALLLFGVPLVALQMWSQSLLLRGAQAPAKLIGFTSYLLLLYVIGVARFRAIRYRLSRTYWHGIRGGSSDRGISYGWSYLWRIAIGGSIFGFLLPWAMTETWNMRWNRMSYGPHMFGAGASHRPVLRRMLLCLVVAIVVLFGTGAIAGGASRLSPSGSAIMSGVTIAMAVLLIIALVVSFYSVFQREMIGNLTLGDLQFHFPVHTRDYLKLYLGDLALLIVTLGLGFVFVGYRHWTFMVHHLEATGQVTLEELSQSEVTNPRQGEGLLEAFDVGAF